MADTPVRAGPTLLTVAEQTLYTVPAATTAILKHITVTNSDDTTDRLLTYSIGADGTGTRLGRKVPVTRKYSEDLWIPMSAGETLRAQTDAANSLTMTIGIVEIT